MYMYAKCHALDKASALSDRGLNILKTSGVLITIILTNVHSLVGGEIRHILHLGIILDRGLSADNDLGVHHC